MILSSSLPGCTIERVIRSDGRLVVFAHARRVHGRCPTCDTTSSAVHSRYGLRPADLPSIGQPMTLRLRVLLVLVTAVALEGTLLDELRD